MENVFGSMHFLCKRNACAIFLCSDYSQMYSFPDYWPKRELGYCHVVSSLFYILYVVAGNYSENDSP